MCIRKILLYDCLYVCKSKLNYCTETTYISQLQCYILQQNITKILQISSDDLLPKNICPVCLKYLEQSYKFKIQFLSTEKLFKEIIEKNSEPNIILINDTDYFKNGDNSSDFYDWDETSTDEVVKNEGISVKKRNK